MANYSVLLVAALIVLSIPVLTLFVITPLIRASRVNKVKLEPYECGNPPTSLAFDHRFSVRYFLIAVLFTELYYLTLVWDPQAMHLLKPFEEMKPSELRGELLYFSMVTISTVGYGDVLPVSSTARMLAVIEAVMGQFFVAVLVGMFVGMYASQLFANRRASSKGQRDVER